MVATKNPAIEPEKKKNFVVSACDTFQTTVIGGLENAFGKYGRLVAKYPQWVLLGSLAFLGLTMIGLLNYVEETDGLKLWMPGNSEFRDNYEWLGKEFPSDTRVEQVLIFEDGGNVLTANNMKAIYSLRQAIAAIVTENGTTWEKQCDKVPIAGGAGGGGGYPGVCAAVNGMTAAPSACNEGHVFELWAENGEFNANTRANIDGLTDQAVLDKINAFPFPRSGLKGGPWFAAAYLGDPQKDANDKIVSSQAMVFRYFVKKIIVEGQDEREADPVTEEFEDAFIKLVNEYKFPDGSKLVAYPFAAKSFGDIAGDSISGDLSLLAAGYIIVIIYVMIMLGKFNAVENRALLSTAGIASVGMGLGASYGFCSALGFFYTPMHSIIPFLLLGIGIDDMFVIVQSFDNIRGKDLELPLVERFGLCMKHAGVAITITSVTDLLAFGISASTVLPALQSFCVWAAFGIVFVFFFMASFFLSLFVFDQRRIEAMRCGCICCLKMDKWTPNKCSQKEILPMLFDKYAGLLLKLPFKIAILIVTLLLVGGSSYGVYSLETDFDAKWFIDEGTYLRNYFEAQEKYFPSTGISGAVYIAEVTNYNQYMGVAKELGKELAAMDSLNEGSGTAGFHYHFETFLDLELGAGANYPETAPDKTAFQEALTEFLFTFGSRYRQSVKFKGNLTCGEAAPDMKMFTIPIKHKSYDGATEHIEKIKEVNDVVGKYKDKFGEGARVFAFSQLYSNYKTMEIITTELVRNILLALLCVFLATLFLIANLFASILVVISVFITLIEVGGFMFFWGLTIDTSSAILITVAMGLAVDYSAHIGHAFMVTPGERDERIRITLVNMGPAVLNGGTSTFLAFAMLMLSKSYVFITFFKIFFLIVFFGLFSGLCLLPVILSLVGPKAASNVDEDTPPPRPVTVKVAPVTEEPKKPKPAVTNKPKAAAKPAKPAPKPAPKRPDKTPEQAPESDATPVPEDTLPSLPGTPEDNPVDPEAPQ